MIIRKIVGKLQPLLYKGIKWYYAKPRKITKRGIQIILNPSVFHPSFYLSTDIFLDYLLTQNIEKKSVLELGTGNGFISLYLAKHQQCKVTASDINIKAVEGIQQSALVNQVEITAIHSDLFEAIASTHFDYILVNPPYYPKAVDTSDEHAFYCGANYEYFHRFFEQIIPFLKSGSQVLMILSETAPIDSIFAIGKESKIKSKAVYTKRKNGEDFFIFQISLP